jgi:2-C-methyl-D-erythritol 4-phosphate cytidylyltransferase
MKKYVIIVAGGSGSRMLTAVPKQFALLNDRPVLMHVFDAFLAYDTNIQFVLVLAPEYTSQWDDLCSKFNFTIPHQLVPGGNERFFSVKNGLQIIPANSLVAVHDAARPLVSTATIQRVFDGAEATGNAIPVVPVNESVRVICGGHNKTFDRSALRMVQTPQVFRSELLKDAYEQTFNQNFTDDASVFEAAGHQINLVEGNRGNIKITYPTDLVIAQALLNIC